ncbi:MAG TPA: biliverdin-producing heme oxygenase, partial [Longimicrobiales bacterium]|nr:biliverdin-producing heme oxygenase [Longimicrobiales bacterium]
MREATARTHEKLEEAHLAQRLQDGSIERQAYVDYLRAIAVLVANLRTAIRRHGTTDLARVLPTLEDWAERLDADIRTLAGDDATANERAQTAVLKFIQEAYGHLGHETDWLYGVLYVLHGSHNGNRRIADAITRGLDLTGDAGTSYFRATEGRSGVWRSFKAYLDERLVSEEQRRQAGAGAAETFECMQRVFQALEEPDGRAVTASAVNPEAGDHPVHSDPRLARLASEVGRASHLAFGYLVRRYGSRGEAFARSDGVWMVTLLEMPEDRAHRRVEWLAGLLSSRGIPSICLEYHLERFHHALSEAGASGGEGVSRLLELSRHVGAS